MPTNTHIDNMYDNQLDTELSALKRSQQQAVNQINQQKESTRDSFYDKRNEADVVNFQNQKRLREMMAASGLGRSGENISGMVGFNAARQESLGDLNREEQGILGQLNTKIGEINDPSHANEIRSRIEALRSQALLDALERERDRAASRGGGGGGGYAPQSVPQPNLSIPDDIMRRAESLMRDRIEREQRPHILRPFTGTTAYYNKMSKLVPR